MVMMMQLDESCKGGDADHGCMLPRLASMARSFILVVSCASFCSEFAAACSASLASLGLRWKAPPTPACVALPSPNSFTLTGKATGSVWWWLGMSFQTDQTDYGLCQHLGSWANLELVKEVVCEVIGGGLKGVCRDPITDPWSESRFHRVR
ncbi:hypothetical protein VTK26DRAFT_5572 [Humicola hyalothermophila]